MILSVDVVVDLVAVGIVVVVDLVAVVVGLVGLVVDSGVGRVGYVGFTLLIFKKIFSNKCSAKNFNIITVEPN